MLRKDLITCQEVAEILGRSPSTISRALKQGRLKYGDTKRKLLVRQGLEQRFSNATRPKADCPQKVKRDDKAADDAGNHCGPYTDFAKGTTGVRALQSITSITVAGL